ncbi:MAG: hypothetical protein KDE22_04850 [Rhodobacterales bacterium]|nr:hypothetical protein [Rhodobacterales bacterium]
MLCRDRLEVFEGLTVAASLVIQRHAGAAGADPYREAEIRDMLEQLRLEFASAPFRPSDLDAWTGGGLRRAA